jgi:dihydrofolate synthase/folylpolyglutamate synthase
MAPDLGRITDLAGLLGDPQLAYPSIHVTGTNGKTSVTRMVATLLAAAGVSAGTYTSPHLQSVRERFTVAGRWIGQRAFGETYAAVAPLAGLVDEARFHDGRGDERVTYFEMLTAMAYWWFADKPVDVGVFEVGMGGRWDATNLVRGDVAVLTPVDVDHRELGDHPVAVAEEKAGIIKAGSVVVSAAQDDDVLAVIRRHAAERGAEVRVAGDHHDLLDRRFAVGGQSLRLRVGARVVVDILLPVFGRHQADNAVLALAAVAALLGGSFDRVGDDVIRQGFAAVTAPGRLEVVRRSPAVVLDGAHNPHGARSAAAAVGDSFDFRNLMLVVACLADKDLHGILSAYRDLVDHVVVTTVASPRAADVAAMASTAQRVWAGTGVVVETAADVAEGLDLALGIAGPGDGILVTGSLYTVGAARDRYLPVTDSGDEIVVDADDDQRDDADDGPDDDEVRRAIDAMLDGIDDEWRSAPPDASP